jgi:hypothetical protein
MLIRNCLLGHRKKKAKFLMRTCRSTFLYVTHLHFCRRLYESCLSEGVALTLLIKFAAEGDNSADGLVLAGALNDLISFLADKGRQQLRAPPSWQHVFGPPPPRDLFW